VAVGGEDDKVVMRSVEFWDIGNTTIWRNFKKKSLNFWGGILAL